MVLFISYWSLVDPLRPLNKIQTFISAQSAHLLTSSQAFLILNVDRHRRNTSDTDILNMATIFIKKNVLCLYV